MRLNVRTRLSEGDAKFIIIIRFIFEALNTSILYGIVRMAACICV